ncbi:hypothetical protein ACFY2Z_12450 [Streptomyces sp. NPDC001222]|uniref:hypothetical protein n=1 Tax=Streptomyces sp. NPDC001222 TaxID=3364548 RepID=UPI0036AB47C5
MTTRDGWMRDEELAEALAVVIRDLRAHRAVLPEVREDAEHGLMLYAPDGSGQGVPGWPDDTPAERLARLADHVQDWAVEALWAEGAPAVWPHCPAHPGTHPLTASVVRGEAVWTCPRSGATVAAVGALEDL